MDSIVSIAIEEICAEGPAGISPGKLWSILQSPLESFNLQMDDSVKEIIWMRLLAIPDLIFRLSDGSIGEGDPIIEIVDQAERMGVEIIAEEHLRDGFLGVSDLKASNVEITPILKKILERLAVARYEIFNFCENSLFFLPSWFLQEHWGSSKSIEQRVQDEGE